MGFEKDVPKSGFFQIFDWTSKSRKKLFSNNSDLPENSKQGKRRGGNFPSTRLSLISDDDNNENGIGTNFRGGSDFSCASSMTDEEGFGSRAPSVVARLMGLDSLPNSASQDPYSTPYFDTRSLQETQEHRYHEINLNQNCSSSSRNFADPKPKKPPAMTMIEKFRTEVLPPRSSRSIPITHHRLLSPIKSPGFLSSGNPARVMEAAAKIITEPGREFKTPLSGSSSAPMKVQALREKAQATQRKPAAESSASKSLKGQSMTKSWNGPGSKNEGKSISLAIQAKVNVQKREGLERQERDNGKSTSTNAQKASKNPSGVLRQNNQKQNNSSASKPLVSNSQSRKLLSRDSSFSSSSSSLGRQKALKIGPRKSGPSTEKIEKEKKEAPYSVSNSFPRRKRSMNPSNGKTSSARNQKSVRASENWAEESRKKGMDVVSFTFTAPLTRSSSSPSFPGSDSQNSEQCKKRVLVDSDGLKFPSSMGYNVLGGDALSLLLEEKLRELTFGLESSSTSASAPHSERDHNKLFDFEFFSTSAPCSSSSASNQHSRGVSDMDQFEAGKVRSPRNLSPVSILEPSFSVESCDSTTFTADSISTEGNAISGSKLCWTAIQPEAHHQETNTNHNSNPSKKFDSSEADTEELSDSASSLANNNHHQHYPPKASIATNSDHQWELEYMKEILSDLDTMFDDFTSGRSLDMLNPDFFDTLENRKRSNMERNIRTRRRRRRRELFDSVGECLDLRFSRCVNGGFEMWAKGCSLAKKKDRLAEEIYKEISGREKGWGDSMVDELVENDMTARFGKWLEFDADVAELGLGLDDLIFASLIDELVADVF